MRRLARAIAMQRVTLAMKTCDSSNTEGRSDNEDTHSSNTEGRYDNEYTRSNNTNGRSGNENTCSSNASTGSDSIPFGITTLRWLNRSL
ncbi:hypothetical protein AMTRI_Chr01g112290 [Amborella trichopoda]